MKYVTYKHEIAQLSCLISHLLWSTSRLLYCNEEVLRLSLPLLLSETHSLKAATAAASCDRCKKHQIGGREELLTSLLILWFLLKNAASPAAVLYIRQHHVHLKVTQQKEEKQTT